MSEVYEHARRTRAAIRGFINYLGASEFVGGYFIDVMAEYRGFTTVEHGERKTRWNTVREEKRRGAGKPRAPVNTNDGGMGLPHKKEVVCITVLCSVFRSPWFAVLNLNGDQFKIPLYTRKDHYLVKFKASSKPLNREPLNREPLNPEP